MIRIYIDANILITAFECKDEASDSVWQVLRAAEVRSVAAATSQLTLAEILPKPLASNQLDLVQVYEDLLSRNGLFDVVPITPGILSSAARVRAARLSMKLPDAIHIATARHAACQAIFTADKRLAMPSGPQSWPLGRVAWID